MKFKVLIGIFVAILNWCSARDDVRTHFVSSFVFNEQKPTVVILYDLCWNKNDQVFLTKGLMKAGNRVSTTFLENKYQGHELLFILDLDCPDAEETIRNVSTRNLLRAPYRWLMLTSSESSGNEALMNSSVLADSDVVVAGRRGDYFHLIEVHRPSLSHEAVTTLRGVYNGTFYELRPRRELYRRRMDLKGHPLTMSNVVQDSNKTMYHLPREDGLDFVNDAITKICWMVAKLAFLMLNATPRHTFSYRWGYKVDGQWSGMISDLHSGKADLGTNCVISDPERLSVVSYTDTLAPFRMRFIFRQPPLSYVSNIYSMPFSSGVWLAISACAAVSAAALWAATRWEATFGKSSTQLDGGFSDALLLTVSAVSQQGCVMEPKRSSGRITVWSVFGALMALHAAYSAYVVTLLQAPSHSITTLSQLVSSKITLAANDVDYHHFIFKQYNDPVRVAVYKNLQPAKGNAQFYNMKEGIEKIRQGLFAFHCMTEQLYRRVERTFREHEKCDLTEVDLMNTFHPYVPIGKDSPYIELIRVAFKRIRETGNHSALNRRHQTRKPRCEGNMSAFSSVGADEIRPVLCLMCAGMALSLAILAIEILIHYLKAKLL